MAPPFLVFFLAPYEAVTVVLYVRLFYILLVDNNFRYMSFYRLIIALGIWDLLHYVVEFCFYRLAYISVFIELYGSMQKSHWISAISVCIFMCTYNQLFLHVAISFNRFSAICFPLHYKKIWKKLYSKLLATFFVVALMLSSDMLLSVGKYAPMLPKQPEKGLIIVKEYEYYQFDQSLLTVLISSICCAACLTMNLGTFILILRHKKRTIASQNTNQQKTASYNSTEFHLFLVALFMVLPQCVLAGFHFILRMGLQNKNLAQFLSSDDATVFVYNMMLHMWWLEDLYSLSQPWILLIVCAELRTVALKPFWRWLPCMKKQQFQTKVTAINVGITMATL